MCKTAQVALRLRRGTRLGTISGQVLGGVPASDLPRIHECATGHPAVRPTVASSNARVP